MREWGIRGQLKALPLSDTLYLLTPDKEVVVNLSAGGSESLKIRSIRRLGRYALVSFYNINEPETASKYRGSILSAGECLLPAKQEREYFYEQIIGLAVITTDGDILGRVSDIFETGSNDVYVVQGPDKAYLIPAIHDIVREIQLEEGRIIIQVVKGLLD
jgi:16S rRNA processing protein RimM